MATILGYGGTTTSTAALTKIAVGSQPIKVSYTNYKVNEGGDTLEYKVYPGIVDYLNMVTFGPWEYWPTNPTFITDKGKRLRLQYHSIRYTLQNGEKTPWQSTSTTKEIENGVPYVSPNWVYDWIETGNSTRTSKAGFTFSDGFMFETESIVETGGTRFIVFRDQTPAGDIPAGGGSVVWETVTHDYWGNEGYIQSVPISGVITTLSGFTIENGTPSSTKVRVSRGNNASSSRQGGALTGSKAGFITRSNSEATYQTAGVHTKSLSEVWTDGTTFRADGKNTTHLDWDRYTNFSARYRAWWNGVLSEDFRVGQPSLVNTVNDPKGPFSQHTTTQAIWCSNADTTISNEVSATITCSYNGASATTTVTRQENKIIDVTGQDFVDGQADSNNVGPGEWAWWFNIHFNTWFSSGSYLYTHWGGGNYDDDTVVTPSWDGDVQGSSHKAWMMGGYRNALTMGSLGCTKYTQSGNGRKFSVRITHGGLQRTVERLLYLQHNTFNEWVSIDWQNTTQSFNHCSGTQSVYYWNQDRQIVGQYTTGGCYNGNVRLETRVGGESRREYVNGQCGYSSLVIVTFSLINNWEGEGTIELTFSSGLYISLNQNNQNQYSVSIQSDDYVVTARGFVYNWFTGSSTRHDVSMGKRSNWESGDLINCAIANTID